MTDLEKFLARIKRNYPTFVAGMITAGLAVAAVCGILFSGVFTFVEQDQVIQLDNYNQGTIYYQDDSNQIHTLDIEVATTPEQRSTGLMNRNYLPPTSGMLFVFGSEQPLSFWMQNTYISLDIIFMDSNSRVVSIHKNTVPLQEKPTYNSSEPAQYVLETNAGWSDQVGLEVGDEIVLNVN